MKASGLIAAASAMALAGCANFNATSRPAADLGHAAAGLIEAEGALFDRLQAASDRRRELAIEQKFIAEPKWEQVAEELDRPRIDYGIAKRARLKALAQLQAYVNQIGAITAAGDAGWPAAQARAIIDDTETFAKNAGGGLNPAQKSDIATAQNIVSSIGTAIIQAQAAKDIRQMAIAAQPGIEQIAAMIRQDDAIIDRDFVRGTVAAEDQSRRAILHSLFDAVDSKAERYRIITNLAPLGVIDVDHSAVDRALAILVQANKDLAQSRRQDAGQAFMNAVQAANAALAAKSGR